MLSGGILTTLIPRMQGINTGRRPRPSNSGSWFQCGLLNGEAPHVVQVMPSVFLVSRMERN